MIAQPRIDAPSTLSMPKVGSLGAIIDSDVVRSLIQEGAKIRIKSSSSEEGGGLFDSHALERVRDIRLILSTRGRGLIPGRRLAEVRSVTVDAEGLDDSIETLKVTVYGPNRTLLGRERLFDGKVESWAEALQKLNGLRELKLR